MVTVINIIGQLNGNLRLKVALTTIDSRWSDAGFNNYRITYPTKAKAKKALWEAYKKLKESEPEFAKNGISYSKHGILNYDASTAQIQD